MMHSFLMTDSLTATDPQAQDARMGREGLDSVPGNASFPLYRTFE